MRKRKSITGLKKSVKKTRALHVIPEIREHEVYDYEKSRGRRVVSINVDETKLVNRPKCYEGGSFIPNSPCVMLDAVDVFCDHVKVPTTKEVRVYLPRENLKAFSEIVYWMGMDVSLQFDHVLVQIK